MPVALTKEEAHEFLDSRPGWLILTTIDRDGFPHTVPVGYFRLDDDIYTGGREGTQRVANIRRNPRVSVLVETGGSMQDVKGLLVQGEADIVTEPDAVLRLMRESFRRRGVPEEQLPNEALPEVSYIRIRPKRYISWDYSRNE